MVSCGSLERWLDEGMPEAGAAAARAHASGCPLCGPRLREAERLETLLATPVAAAPTGFEDRVIARVAAEPPRTVPALPRARPSRLPWWSWLGADPTLPLALAAASVLLGLTQAALALAKLPLAGPLATLELGPIGDAIGRSPLHLTAVTMALLPPVLLFSYALYRSTQRIVRTSLLRR